MARSDLPVAAPDPAEALIVQGRTFASNVRTRAARSPEGIAQMIEDLADLAAALLAERQQDKQLPGEVDVLLDCLAECAAITGNTDWAGQARALAERIRAALAVEEDATPGKPETPGNSGAAVEEDTG